MGHVEALKGFFTKLEDDLENANIKDAVSAFALSRQRERARKRARLGDNTLSDRAVSDFCNLNNLVGSTILSVPSQVASDARNFIRFALWRYSSSVSELNIQVALDRVHLLDLWRFGPGASFDTKGTHACQKIGQTWSTTLSATPYVTMLRRFHPYLNARDSALGGVDLKPVRGSKISTVPKNEEKDRTIAIEPLGNMCLQLAAGAYLEGALRSIGLDITKQQPKNRLLARKGSKDGTLCTIDLSSASDMITPALVQLLLPPEWFELLMAIRCQEMLLPNGEWITLQMVSTMGNGFTFPLMTLLITSLIYGFRCQRKGSPTLWIDWSETAVFGDDIIIRSTEYDDFCSILESSGLVVNKDKSYFDGSFRESCGGDYYDGEDVTPFYVTSLSCDAEIYIALNKVAEWSAKVGVVPTRCLGYLFQLLKHPCHFVPEWSNPDQGYKTTQVTRRYKKLLPRVVQVRYLDEFFLYPLACAGYVTSSARGPIFMPRLKKTRYRTVSDRLPRGYLDGRDPLTRTPQVSSHCDFIAWMGSVAFPESDLT